MMKLQEIMQLTTAILAVLAVVWRTAQLKGDIVKYIDAMDANNSNYINDVDKKLEIFLSRYEERKEMVDYKLNGLNEKIDHKFNRCFEEIKNLKQE